jgi:hypothetical protein
MTIAIKEVATTTPIFNQDLYLPASIVTSSLITIGVASFAAKWMFTQLVSYWSKEFDELKSEVKQLADRDEQLKNHVLSLERKVATDYVSREDWIRNTVTIETKLDRMDTRFTAQMDRLIDRVGEYCNVKLK